MLGELEMLIVMKPIVCLNHNLCAHTHVFMDRDGILMRQSSYCLNVSSAFIKQNVF